MCEVSGVRRRSSRRGSWSGYGLLPILRFRVIPILGFRVAGSPDHRGVAALQNGIARLSCGSKRWGSQPYWMMRAAVCI